MPIVTLGANGEVKDTVTAHLLADTSALGPLHTVSGLTSGQALFASGATTALFRAIAAGDIASGTLALARGGTNADLSSVAANQVFASPSSGAAGAMAARALVFADIPSSSNPGTAAAVLATDASGNLTVKVVGANGVAFPASQVASADANTLDDYEEGTYLCVATGSTSGSNDNVNGASGATYIKVGKVVYFSIGFAFPGSPNAMVGDLLFSLPFANGGSQLYFMHGSNMVQNGGTTAQMPNFFSCILISASNVRLVVPDVSASFSATSATLANKFYQVNGVYNTA